MALPAGGACALPDRAAIAAAQSARRSLYSRHLRRRLDRRGQRRILGVGAGMLTLAARRLHRGAGRFRPGEPADGEGRPRHRGDHPGRCGGSQLFNALTSFIVTKAATAEQARGIMFWLLGTFRACAGRMPGSPCRRRFSGLVVCLWHARPSTRLPSGRNRPPRRHLRSRRTISRSSASRDDDGGDGIHHRSIGFRRLVIPMAARMLVGVRHGVLLRLRRSSAPCS